MKISTYTCDICGQESDKAMGPYGFKGRTDENFYEWLFKIKHICKNCRKDLSKVLKNAFKDFCQSKK